MKIPFRLAVAVALLATAMIGTVSAATLYVSLDSTNPIPPFASWETAATNIQQAVDAAKASDTVMVTNGVYDVGGRDVIFWNTNSQELESRGLSRVVITNSVRLESVNGPLVTTVEGNQPTEESSGVRCVYLGTNAVLSGLTLTNGGYGWGVGCGGGVFCERFGVVTNCVLTGNSVGTGGGAFGGTLYNCVLTGNSAVRDGGASESTLYNCTLTGNSDVMNDLPLCGACGTGGAGLCTLHNCTLTGNSSGRDAGGARDCTLYNCVLTGNRGNDAGGARDCTLYNCVLTGNRGGGGGAVGGTLYNCTLTGNWACSGGGASGGTLYNCTLTGNTAGDYGGGASDSTLYNCTLTGNSADYGGGAYGGTLYNCVLTDNSAGDKGGGAYGGTLFNCTLTGNSAQYYGGGAYGDKWSPCWLYNSIIYYNSGGNFEPGDNTQLNYCCTTPLPTNGVGNITGPPLFMDMAAGDFRLREDSPCIDAGTNLVGLAIVPTVNPDTGETLLVPYTYEPTDIRGNTRFIDGNGDGKVAWDIGAYEFNSFKPPRFSVFPQLTPNGWQLNVTGAANKWARLQRSSNLKDWEDIWSGFMGAEGVKQVNDGDTGPKAMFYRVVVP